MGKGVTARWINEGGSERVRGLNPWLEEFPLADWEISSDQHVQSNQHLFIQSYYVKKTQTCRGICYGQPVMDVRMG